MGIRAFHMHKSPLVLIMTAVRLAAALAPVLFGIRTAYAGLSAFFRLI